MKLEGKDVNDERLVGFMKIVDLENAQQATVNTDRLAKAVRFLASLKDLGFSEVTITVEKGEPVILGGKSIGIALAAAMEADE